MKYQNLPVGRGFNAHPHYLTYRQEYIWREMLDFQLVNQRPQTVREICTAIGVVSTNSVRDHLSALIRKGFVERGKKNTSRTVVAIDPTYVPTEKGLEACG